MTLFGLLNRNSSREGTKPSSTPVSKTNWTSFKSKLSRRKEQPTTLSKTFIDARESSETSRNEPHHREPNLLWEIDARHPSVTSPPPSTKQPRSSADNQSLGSRAESSGSSRPFTPDSIASSSLSKYNYIFFAPLRASMLGETGSAEHEARPLDSQEDDGAGCEADFSQPDALISPLDHAAPETAVRSVEGIERSPMREYEPACALESFIAMSPYGGDDISTCLRGGTVAKARRIQNAFRSQHTHTATTSCERIKELLAHQSFNTPSATDSSEKDAQPGNTKKNESASGEGKPSLTVAPINLNPLSLEKSTQVLAIRPFKAVGSAGNHCQPVNKHEDESAGSEAGPSRTVAPNFPITSSRKKCIRVPALAPILELISEDYPESFNASSSLRGGDQRHKPNLRLGKPQKLGSDETLQERRPTQRYGGK
ncbi:hypothetical protein M407DRAFT_23480 [Tulasnella calospora MUT 4182]|uniref:Uncharacterized protein n=1 Tax=Tulasnella calospora MUT 4182 TaxID=1051891 RepID=A0A0C3QL65_9AGAM|nr:hypothetical protein M407DRAFT_23480 [Tulasnella calospora MUT 4182]